MRSRGTLIALLVLAGLLAFIYFYEYRGEEGREAAKRAEESLVSAERDRIQGIELSRPSGNPVRLVKESGRWRLTDPIRTLADAQKVESLVSTLTFLRIDRVIEEVADEDRGEYGLHEPALRVTLDLAPGEKEEEPMTVAIGDTGPFGGVRYASRTGDARVLIVSGNVDPLLEADAESLRMRKLTGIDSWKISGLGLIDGDRRLALTRDQDDNWAIVAPTPFPAERSKVQELYGDLVRGEADAFAHENPTPGDLKAAGLASPSLEVTIEEEGAIAPLRVTFGGPDGSGRVHARRSDMEAVMLVKQEVIERLHRAAAAPGDLRDPRPAPIDRYAVTGLRLERPGKPSLDLRRDEEMEWRVDGGTGEVVPRERVDALLDAIENLKAASYLDDPPEISEPALVLALLAEPEPERREITLRVAGRTVADGSGREVISSVAGPAYIAPGDRVETLLRAAEELDAPSERPEENPPGQPAEEGSE